MEDCSKRFSKLLAKSKNPLILITATGIAALSLQETNPNLISFSGNEKIRTGFHGILRSSRAIYTIASNAIDYKYSLSGLRPDSADYRRELSEVHLRSAKRILKLCEANRGFYVKAAQFAASLRQVPKEYTLTLSSLQDQATPCPFEAIKEVLVSNLGEDLSEIFLSFDEQPIAAASIAQVHRALLKNSQEVAVKVQYPGLAQQMKLDITTMAILSNSIEWIFPECRFEWMVTEFEKAISVELDFVQEAKNSERTARNFEKNNVVQVPHVFWDLTRSQVLTMQFCNGHKVLNSKNHLSKLESSCSIGQRRCLIAGHYSKLIIDFGSHKDVIQRQAVYELNRKTKPHLQSYMLAWLAAYHEVDDLESLKKLGINPTEVAKALIEVFAQMIFIHGFLHGDSHPGNILVSPEGCGGFSLVILDHGVYKELDEGFRLDYCHLWKALILLDAHRIQQLGERFGVGKYSRYFPVIFTGRTIDSKSALGRGMSSEEKRNLKEELSSLNMGEISLFMESLPPDFLTIVRTDELLRSIASRLGASQRTRLLTYAKYALYGLTAKSVTEPGHKVWSALSNLRTSLTYIQLRVILGIWDLLSQIQAFRHSVTKTLKRMMFKVVHFQNESILTFTL